MRRRLLISYLSITAFVLVVLEVPLGISFARAENRQLTSDLTRDAYVLGLRVEEALESGATEGLPSEAKRYEDETGARVVIVDVSGVAVADSSPPSGTSGTGRDFSSRPEIEAALGGEEQSGTRYSDTLGTDLLYVAVPVASGGKMLGAVRVSYPLSFLEERVRRNWYLLGAIAVVVLLAVFLVSLVLARSVTRPLADLEAGAARLGRGELRARVPVPIGPPELSGLAESFNATAARLEELVRSQQAFVADASHQLRTPLAALRLRLEILEGHVDADAAGDLEGALDEVRRLSHLVDGLLVLARAEEGGSAAEMLDLGAIVAGRVEAWEALAAERGARLDARVPRGTLVLATPGRLEQVLDNLLNNALEVAPVGTSITLTTARTRDRVELRVADEGPGMPPEARARAFDRFWRPVGAGRGGAGIGLAIVRQLVRSDGGEVELGAGAAGGLEVVLRLRGLAATSASAPSL